MTREGLLELIAEADYVHAADNCYVAYRHLKESERVSWRLVASAVINAIEASGHVVVPVEPTSWMLDTAEGDNVRCGCEECDAAAWEKYRDTWEAMLSANPLKP